MTLHGKYPYKITVVINGKKLAHCGFKENLSVVIKC